MASTDSKTVQLVLDYCGAKSAPKVDGLGPVCEEIARASTSKDALLGTSAESSAQVLEWLTWVSTELKGLMDDKLYKLNDHLQSRTFLVGRSLTLADLVVFGVVSPAVAAFPAAQIGHFASLLRWYDHIQHTVPAAASFPKANIPKVKFNPPAAPAAAPKASSSSAAPAKADGAVGKAAAPAASADSAKSAATVATDKGKGGKEASSAAKPADGKAAAKVRPAGSCNGRKCALTPIRQRLYRIPTGRSHRLPFPSPSMHLYSTTCNDAQHAPPAVSTTVTSDAGCFGCR